MWLIIAFGIGAVVGGILTAITLRSKTVGSLRIDTSDPDDGPYLFLELSKDLSTIYNKKYVTVKVNTESFISHE